MGNAHGTGGGAARPRAASVHTPLCRRARQTLVSRTGDFCPPSRRGWIGRWSDIDLRHTPPVLGRLCVEGARCISDVFCRDISDRRRRWVSRSCTCAKVPRSRLGAVFVAHIPTPGFRPRDRRDERDPPAQGSCLLGGIADQPPEVGHVNRSDGTPRTGETSAREGRATDPGTMGRGSLRTRDDGLAEAAPRLRSQASSHRGW
jgi:hypothetical protein